MLLFQQVASSHAFNVICYSISTKLQVNYCQFNLYQLNFKIPNLSKLIYLDVTGKSAKRQEKKCFLQVVTKTRAKRLSDVQQEERRGHPDDRLFFNKDIQNFLQKFMNKKNHICATINPPTTNQKLNSTSLIWLQFKNVCVEFHTTHEVTI